VDEVRPLALLYAAVLAWLLGFLGFRELEDDRSAYYHALQLFTLDAGDVDDPPMTLEVARLLAPVVAFYAAIRALMAVFREQLQVSWVQLFTRNHTVVAGLGAKGSRLASNLHDAGSKVVVVELDRANGLSEGFRERGIPVVTGDARDAGILRKARPSRARNAVVVCGDDSTNLDVVAALSAPAVFVHVDSLDLRRTLAAEALAGAHPLEPFNVYDVAAALLLERFPSGRNTLVVGWSDLAESVILRAANAWHAADPPASEKLRVTLLDDEAELHLRRLCERFPRLRGACELTSITGSLGADRFTAAYVTVESDAEGLEAALALNDRPGFQGVPVVLGVESEDAGAATLLNERLGPPEDLHPFGVLDNALTPELLLSGSVEVIARLRHGIYIRDEERKGETRETNPAMAPWDELDDDYKRSNRHFAADVGPKLAAVGCALRPSPLAGLEDGRVAFTEDEVELLGRMEHDRWSAERKLAGWKPTDGPRDNDRKLHPLIDRPWEALSAEDQAKDLQPMRELPQMLAQVGFEVVRIRNSAAGSRRAGA
jgi:voltage-gated potassium channel Kch